MKYVVIDWFELYIKGVYDASPSFFESLEIDFFSRGYGTKVWGDVIYLNDISLSISLEVRVYPKSKGIMPSDAALLRVSNKTLYTCGLGSLVLFLDKCSWEYVSVHRVDLAADFLKFDSGLPVEHFIRRVLSGVYRRDKSSLRKDVVQDAWDNCSPNYVAWFGADVSFRLYDKTLELRQVKNPEKRSYIVALWKDEYIVPSDYTLFRESEPHVWRLEFQVQSSSKGWLSLGGDDFVENCLDTFLSPSRVVEFYTLLCNSYFRFYVFEEGKSAAECKKVDILRLHSSLSIAKSVRAVSVDKQFDSDRLQGILCQLRKLSGNPANISFSEPLKQAEDIIIGLIHQNALTGAGIDSAALQKRLNKALYPLFDDMGF